jgi:hypothetical protein
MAADPRLLLQARPTDVGASFSNALLNVGRLQNIQQQREQAELSEQLQPLRNRLLEAQVTTAEQGVLTPTQILDERNTARLNSVAQFSQQALPRLAAGDVEGTRALLQQRRADLVKAARGGAQVDTTEVDEGIRLLDSNPQLLAQRMQQSIDAAQQLSGVQASAGQREFEALIEGLPADEQLLARRVRAGVAPRAGISAQERIAADEDLTTQVAASQEQIKQAEEFGKKTGASRAKAIDSGFERIGKITSNISNLDRAIKAVEAGAGTGAIERRFPSIKAASVELDQIQGELALDVIGAVTFGALSEGELDLAKQIALPAGLDGPQLIAHLQGRQAAQIKLRDYFQEQVDFLDQGGTVAGFLRSKQRQAPPPPPPPPTNGTPAAASVESDTPSTVLQFDSQGNLVQ